MEFYFADIEMLMSGWNTLYLAKAEVPEPNKLDHESFLSVSILVP
jgi:hypothetical protein